MRLLRQDFWSGLPFPSPGNLPDPGREPKSLTLQADSLPSEPPAKPIKVKWALRVEHWLSRFSVFMKRNTREISLCLCVFYSLSLPHPPPCVKMHGESSLGRNNSYQNFTLLAPLSGTSSPQNCENYFCCLFYCLNKFLLFISLSLLYSFMALWLINKNSFILEI